MVVDGSGVQVGIVELGSGLMPRKLGADTVLLFVTPQGFYQQPEITFFHTTTDCSGDRYLRNNGGLLAYFAQMSGSTVFYTTFSDASATPRTEAVNSYEVVRPGADPMAVGECIASEMGDQAVGTAIAVTDSTLGALVAPFRLR
jgi:hypothetical protein